MNEAQTDPPEDEWIPGALWRVLDAYGNEIHVGHDEARARGLLMDGYTLENNLVRPTQTKWKKVD